MLGRNCSFPYIFYGRSCFMSIKKLTARSTSYLALLIALEIVLNRFLSVNTAGVKIGFAFVPVVVAAILFGPIPAAIVNGVADLLGAVLFPIGPYHPGFTVCAALAGAVYGLFLYRPEGGRVRFLTNMLPPVIINNIVIGLLINTIWVSMLYGSKTYLGWFLYRLTEYVVLIPVSLCLIPILIRLCRELGRVVYRDSGKVGRS